MNETKKVSMFTKLNYIFDKGINLCSLVYWNIHNDYYKELMKQLEKL